MRQIVLVLGLARICTGAVAFDHSHGAWNWWLGKFTQSKATVTQVDYVAARSEKAALNEYLASLSRVTTKEYEEFTGPERLAFLINAYNAFTVKLVLDNFPIGSIKDLDSVFSGHSKEKFFQLLDKKRSLAELERDLIGKTMDEPRLYFTLTSAAKGSPPLRSEAYTAAKMEEQLEAQTKLFVRDTTRNRWDPEAKKFRLSRCFEWYAEAFKKRHGSVQAFLAPLLGVTDEERQHMKRARISYLRFDWALNEKADKSLSKSQP